MNPRSGLQKNGKSLESILGNKFGKFCEYIYILHFSSRCYKKCRSWMLALSHSPTPALLWGRETAALALPSFFHNKVKYSSRSTYTSELKPTAEYLTVATLVVHTVVDVRSQFLHPPLSAHVTHNRPRSIPMYTIIACDHIWL